MTSPIAIIGLLGLLAAGDDADARRLFEAGSQAYEQGRYATAISAFEAAHKVAPRPVTAFSTAQAYRLQYWQDSDPPKLARAIGLYREYLDLAPDGDRREIALQHIDKLTPVLEALKRERGAAAIAASTAALTQVIVSSRTPGAVIRVDGSAEERAPASFDVPPGRHHIEVSAPQFVAQTLDTVAVAGKAVAIDVTLEPRPGSLAVRAPAGSRLFVDGKLMGSAPVPGAIEVPAGHHSLAVVDSGKRPFSRDFDLERAQRIDVNVTLERTPQRYLAMTMTYGGLAVLAGSAVMWGLAIDRNREAQGLVDGLATEVSTDTNLPTRLQRLDDARVAYLTAGGITAGIGVAAAAVGLVLWTTDRPEVPAPVITPVVAPGLGGVSVRGSF